MSGDTKAHGRAPSLGRLFDRPPPHSLEAEMSLLGSIILDVRMLADAQDHITTPDMFYSTQHAAIWDSIVRVWNETSALDLVLLQDDLRDRAGSYAPSGEYLVELAESVPTAVNARHYAKIVKEKWRLRAIIDACGQLVHDAYHEADLDAGGTLLDKASALIHDITVKSTDGSASTTTIQESLDELLDEIVDDRKGVDGVLTGFNEFDALTGGYQNGEFSVIAARPSMGKTALMLSMALNIARGVLGQDPTPVLLLSLEMSNKLIAARFLSMESRISGAHIKRRVCSSDEFKEYQRACDTLAGYPLYCLDPPSMGINRIRSEVRRHIDDNEIKIVFIDYLQLVRGTREARKESRQLEVTSISQGLKSLARETRVPIVCMAQLNRDVEHRTNKRPLISDLRESGSIEQEADLIAMLHREEYYHRTDSEWLQNNRERLGKAVLDIAKQRNGPIGTVHLDWIASCMLYLPASGRTGDYEPRPEDAYYSTVIPAAVAPTTLPPPPVPQEIDDDDLPF